MRFVLHPALRKMRLLPLVAATYFMVSGGPYGIEDILGGAGYRPRHPHPATAAAALEPAHRPHDRRAGRGHPRRGRLLRLGAPRSRALLGLPGELALAHRQRLRHGALPFHLRALPGQVQPRAHRRARAPISGRWPWWSCAARGTCSARPRSATTRSGSLRLLLAPFAVFVVLGFWHGFTAHPAMHWGRTAADAWRAARSLHRHPGRAVELHGLGQRLHHRARGRKSPAQLSARHDRRRPPHRLHLRASAGRHGGGRTLAQGFSTGSWAVAGSARSAVRCSGWPSWPAASSAAWACSTPS